MNWREFLFSFKGRVARHRYWMFVALTIPFIIIAVIWDNYLGNKPFEGPGAIIGLILLWPTLAVQVKRWHDLNMSGWWVLVGFIPIIGSIWVFVANGCLKGTDGDNGYGADPLGQKT